MTPAPKSPLPKRRRGFTIVELLVATAITLALGGMLVSITSSVLEGWRRSSGRLAAESQARLVLDQLARDLQGLVYQADGKCYLAATVLTRTDNTGTGAATQWAPVDDPLDQVTANLPFKDQTDFQDTTISAGPGYRSVWLQHGDRSLKSDLKISEQRFGVAGTWLRFFSETTDGQPAGTTSAVSYQIVRRAISNSPDAEVRWQLYRSTVRPYHDVGTNFPGVLECGMDLFPTTTSPYESSTNTPTGYAADAGSDDAPVAIRRVRSNLVIANNVVDFGVRFYKRTGGTLRLMYPADSPPPSTTAPISSGFIDMTPYEAAQLGGTQLRFVRGGPLSSVADIGHFVSSRVQPSARNPEAGRMPDVIEVMIRVLSEEGARQIAALESGRLGTVPPDSLPNTDQGRSEWWWNIVEANSVVFTQQFDVKLRAH